MNIILFKKNEITLLNIDAGEPFRFVKESGVWMKCYVLSGFLDDLDKTLVVNLHSGLISKVDCKSLIVPIKGDFVEKE